MYTGEYYEGNNWFAPLSLHGFLIVIAIVSLIVVVFLSILITRIATIALTHTGLTRESAKFQARSAFSGAGFTTSESEMVVNHPVRRKIVLALILIGNAGIVAAISSLILTFVKEGDQTTITLRVVILVAGIVFLWAFATSQWVDRWLSRAVDFLLNRYTDLNVKDYASLLHLTGDYRLAELQVKKDDWLEGKTLAETRLREEGINVLGIKRKDGTYLGELSPDTLLQEDDNLVLYGKIDAIEVLDQRKRGTGDREHSAAVKKHEEMLEEEQEKDTAKQVND